MTRCCSTAGSFGLLGFLWMVLLTAMPAIGITLARNGKAAVPVVVAERAGDPVRQAAQMLADYLGRIGTTTFEVTNGDGSQGITVGLIEDFPALTVGKELNATGPAAREQYLLRSHDKGLFILARSETGLRHAIWDTLYRLGHRQFFPGEAWEIIPRQRDLAIEVNTAETPDWLTRRIWYGYGLWDHNREAYAAWQERNRAPGAFRLGSGHAYDDIITRNKAAFEQHPEYYALVNGERKGSKLCISNPGLRELVVQYALAKAAAEPDADTISMEPSDGSGWCECEPCAALGNPADRVLVLANQVAAALAQSHPDRFVAFYAYNEHAAPPTVQKAHPKILVSAATGFLLGKTIEQVIEGWKQAGVQQFGIREYYSVLTWDHDLPGQARGGNLDYLRRSITQFHRDGARFMSAESSDNWGPNGLGYYLATRMMWDLDEADRLDALKADFLDKAFGPARPAMERFYAMIDGATRPLISEDLIGRMYRCLDEAGKLAGDEAGIRQRLDHLLLYTRYVELQHAYQQASGSARQAAFERVIRHAYRMRSTMMVHAKAIYRDVRDKTVIIPPEASWKVPEGENPWKSSQPWERAELDTLLAEGIKNNAVIHFQTVGYSRDLAPAAEALQLQTSVPAKEIVWTGRGERTFYVWIDRAPATISIKATGGMIAHYRNRGPAMLQFIHAPAEADAEEMSQAQTAPDGVERDLTLQTRKTGLHKVVVRDGNDMTRLVLPASLRYSIEMSAASTLNVNGRWNGCFYVPRGTMLVGGFANAKAGQVIVDGNTVHNLSGSGYFEIPVPAGADGKVWELKNVGGTVRLMTVPPFISPTAGQLLLPREVLR